MQPRPSEEDRGEPGERFLAVALLAIAGGTAALQIASLGPLRESFWGFHLYSFLPRAVAIGAWAVLGLGAFFLLARPLLARAGNPTPAPAAAESTATRVRSFFVPVLFAGACALLFWFLRSHQTLLGDAKAIILSVPDGDDFHPRQPFPVAFEGWLYRTLGAFRPAGFTDGAFAHTTVALSSVGFGFLFALLSYHLGRTVSRLAKPGGAALGGTIPWLVTLLVLTQGYTVLFYGYVENYAVHVLAVGLYLWLSLSYLSGRGSLVLLAPVGVFIHGIHLSSITLVPSFAFLLVLGLIRPGRRRDAIFGVAATALSVIALDLVFRMLSPDYSLRAAFDEITRAASRPAVGLATGLGYAFSMSHLRDFLNDQFLIGPMAAFLFVPAFLMVLWRMIGGSGSLARSPVVWFLALAALAPLGGSFFTAEPLLGYPRDWDMFAATGVAYCVAGAALVIVLSVRRRALRQLLAFAVLFSGLQLLPFVVLNHDENLSVERFKTLPLGRGRTQVVVGNFYLESEAFSEAERWFRASIEENPANATAHAFLGATLIHRGRHDEALRSYESAIRLHPTNHVYRINYCGLAMNDGRFAEARPHVVWLTERFPDQKQHWYALATIAGELGDEASRRRANERLLDLLERERRAQPGEAGTHLAVAEILERLGRDEDALTCYREALAVDSTSRDALIDISRLLLRMGREGEARSFVERLETLYPLPGERP